MKISVGWYSDVNFQNKTLCRKKPQKETNKNNRPKKFNLAWLAHFIYWKRAKFKLAAFSSHMLFDTFKSLFSYKCNLFVESSLCRLAVRVCVVYKILATQVHRSKTTLFEQGGLFSSRLVKMSQCKTWMIMRFETTTRVEVISTFKIPYNVNVKA